MLKCGFNGERFCIQGDLAMINRLLRPIPKSSFDMGLSRLYSHLGTTGEHIDTMSRT